jgi:hypothetical protein
VPTIRHQTNVGNLEVHRHHEVTAKDLGEPCLAVLQEQTRNQGRHHHDKTRNSGLHLLFPPGKDHTSARVWHPEGKVDTSIGEILRLWISVVVLQVPVTKDAIDLDKLLHTVRTKTPPLGKILRDPSIRERAHHRERNEDEIDRLGIGIATLQLVATSHIITLAPAPAKHHHEILEALLDLEDLPLAVIEDDRALETNIVPTSVPTSFQGSLEAKLDDQQLRVPIPLKLNLIGLELLRGLKRLIILQLQVLTALR